jgi:hypothetical protein
MLLQPFFLQAPFPLLDFLVEPFDPEQFLHSRFSFFQYLVEIQ